MNQKLNDLNEFLTRQFGIDKFSSQVMSEEQFLKIIEQYLQSRISNLIQFDIDRLFQILYVIDISEKSTTDAFDLGNIDVISQRLAQLIIQRQLKKLQYKTNFQG